MTGSRPKSTARQFAEQHLGDRLSALVDGELGHDARDRVLAHVATCAKCKAEVDAQRRLKNVFAEVAPPSPSESFLARLQGLPAGGPDGGPPAGDPFGGRPGPGMGAGVFDVRREEPFTFGYVPAHPHAPGAAPLPAPGRGFRIHDVSRHEADRAASRGLRFAFVAAGAVSLAAVALGGVTTGMPTDAGADARGGNGAGSNVVPARTQGNAPGTSPETQRRRQGAPLLAQGQGERPLLAGTVVAPTSVSAPLLPGVPTPASGQSIHALTAPVVAGAAVVSPLVRPLNESSLDLTSLSWSEAPEVRTPKYLTAPDPTPTPHQQP
ncbi:anti-sigma factor family protein [Streptomyces mangrovisoli]|uniref:Putative zinc-finger domain-containing protein n=1 Tax=Streptomyces mangrovisoli TaxID=1428628 RepID=A0A1J4NUB8_9ACTN|nr:zf-HC2 domain-containing protein [Streptomyces mangrovisoli]OIJ64845.1 hypothetical protein WN71_026485 [Streptomyces mangrovisoli]